MDAIQWYLMLLNVELYPVHELNTSVDLKGIFSATY